MSILSSYCYFADQITCRLIDLTDIAYNAEWILFPKDVQIGFARIIQTANKPIHFSCVGIANCNLESCKKVFLYEKFEY